MLGLPFWGVHGSQQGTRVSQGIRREESHSGAPGDLSQESLELCHSYSVLAGVPSRGWSGETTQISQVTAHPQGCRGEGCHSQAGQGGTMIPNAILSPSAQEGVGWKSRVREARGGRRGEESPAPGSCGPAGSPPWAWRILHVWEQQTLFITPGSGCRLQTAFFL